MTLTPLSNIIRGPFNFLHLHGEEIRSLLPNAEEALPFPQRVFLENEALTPLWGFPVLLSETLGSLSLALKAYLRQEELAQVATAERRRHDPKIYNEAWNYYRGLLTRALENVTLSSYGRHYPSIFWLVHCRDVALCLKDSPRRVRRMDLKLARNKADQLKYKIFDRYQDRLLTTTYDLVNRLAMDTEEMEEELFPRLLRWMLDNVLIFTEDHVSHTLEELDSYFRGHLNIDGRDLRRRFAAVREWHQIQLHSDPQLRNVVSQLIIPDPEQNPSDLLNRRGYMTFLSRQPGYDEEELLPQPMVQVWESLLVKLKEFELFRSLRNLVIPIRKGKDGRLFRGHKPIAEGSTVDESRLLSSATRPMDFMAPWVVDPVVYRYGLVYDMTDFSSLVSQLRTSRPEQQDHAFRMMFRFQRRVNRLANSYRMKLEKYLGDGAFYSSRHPRDLLVCAVRLQRYYVQALEEGLPFDRGLRIALNFGSYRLIPLRTGGSRAEADRYEFFGHGVVELSRLTTGKASREIDEIKTMLINHGYPEGTVHRFFAPLLDRNVELVDRKEEKRQFFSYINRNGHLVNEGIVATDRFISQLDRELGQARLFRGDFEGRTFLTLGLVDGADSNFRVGLRKLGKANLKGLDKLAVYEIVDGGTMDPASLQEIRRESLLKILDRYHAEWLRNR